MNVEEKLVKNDSGRHHESRRTSRRVKRKLKFLAKIICKSMVLILPILVMVYVSTISDNSIVVDNDGGQTIQKQENSSLKEPISMPQDDIAEDASEVITDLDTIKIANGEILTLVSERYYGHKSFWVYLYKHNRSRIANPNEVAMGTTIIVPHPEMYAINADDSSSVNRAKNIGQEVLKTL